MNGRVTGTDGRSYPARSRTAAERKEVIRQAHRLRCGDGLSMRAAQARLADRGVCLSAGSLHTYLTRWTCELCRAPAQPAPPQRIGVYGEPVFGGQGGSYGWY